MQQQPHNAISGMAGWFGTLASTVANTANTVFDKIDEVAHLSDNNDSGGAVQPPEPEIVGRIARKRSEHEQCAYEIKVYPAAHLAQ